jgi:hypothetical protein
VALDPPPLEDPPRRRTQSLLTFVVLSVAKDLLFVFALAFLSFIPEADLLFIGSIASALPLVP